jgi:hypothetical protein
VEVAGLGNQVEARRWDLEEGMEDRLVVGMEACRAGEGRGACHWVQAWGTEERHGHLVVVEDLEASRREERRAFLGTVEERRQGMGTAVGGSRVQVGSGEA